MATYKLKPGGMHHRFMESRKKVQVIGGGFGNGKTAAAVVKTLQIARSYPGANIYMGMATYKQLNDTMREEFYKWVPNSAVKRWPTVTDNTLYMKNGTKVNFRYLRQKGKGTADGQTVSNLLSATYDLAVVDQIENPEITYKDYLDLLGRLRGSTSYKGTDDTMPVTGPRWLILTANPSFNWVFHKIIKPWQHYKQTGEVHPDLMTDPETGEPMIEVFEAPTYENAHNLEPDFIKGLEAAYTGQFRERYLMGNWGAFEGLVYPDFNTERHMISREVMMRYIFENRRKGVKFEAIEGYDFGLTSPSCYLIGFKDNYGRIFILDGFYERNYNIDQTATRIIQLRDQYYMHLDTDETILADPDIFKKKVVRKSGEGSTSVKDMLLDDYGIFCRPGQNDISSGIAKVSSYLSCDVLPHICNANQQGALIYFADDLYFISDEMGSYFWQTDEGLERIDKPIDRNDHALDTLKYMLSYLPEARSLLFNSRFDQRLMA